MWSEGNPPPSPLPPSPLPHPQFVVCACVACGPLVATSCVCAHTLNPLPCPLSRVCVFPQSKSKLREDISSVHDVMKRNISEVLDRGTKLERACSPARLLVPPPPFFCHFLLSPGLS